MQRFIQRAVVLVSATAACAVVGAHQTGDSRQVNVDARVQAFLDEQRGRWHDLNVPESDGRQLHELVASNRYTRALEIGTSTGHSGIWIAWALAKTGGKLTTIEIDEGRYRQAVANFKRAGVADFIDARLADAHDLVARLDGPFDFVFIDADKDWYTNYAKAVIPKLKIGGCLTAHNVSARMGWRSITGDYYDYVKRLPFMETTVSPGGLAVSYKRRER
jgi:predicted O-methyltransferase YrrM